jgi:hypothetical protein
MVPIEQALFELSSLSAQLNQETEALNAIISVVDRQLAAAKVGVSVWLTEESDPLLASIDAPGGKIRGWVLGYAKLGDTWRLAAHPAERHWSESYECPGEGSWVTRLDDGMPVALASAPRIVRVDGAAHLERLVNALSQKVKGFIENIAKARSFVGTETAAGKLDDNSKTNSGNVARLTGAPKGSR